MNPDKKARILAKIDSYKLGKSKLVVQPYMDKYTVNILTEEELEFESNYSIITAAELNALLQADKIQYEDNAEFIMFILKYL